MKIKVIWEVPEDAYDMFMQWFGAWLGHVEWRPKEIRFEGD